MGALGSTIGQSAIFLAAASLTIPALIALGFVRKQDIDHERARNAGKDHKGRPTLQGLAVLLKNRQLLWLTCSAALFQLADASMLALAVEGIGRIKAAQGSLMASAMIVAPLVVAAILAPWVGYFSELWGRKPLLLMSFAAQIIRAAMFGLFSSPVLLIAVQLLDGISGAIRTVLMTVIVADLTTGTGRFNLARGAIGMVVSLAAAASTTIFGMVAQDMGRWAAFLGMATVAGAGGAVVWLLLNETRPETYID
jgi:MFS family permease